MAKTYYLTTDISPTAKQLSKLEGWEGDAAGILLGGGDDKISKLRILLNAMDEPIAETQRHAVRAEMLSMLPKAIRSRAKIFLHHASDILKETEDGLTISPDGTVSSPMIDILRYYCSSHHIPIPLPVASDSLEELFRSSHMPQSAFGKGRFPTHHSTTTITPWISKTQNLDISYTG